MGRKKKIQEKYMAIQLSASRQYNKPTNRYINWIDEHWYETIDFPNYSIQESKIDDVKQWLKQHYINYATFLHEDGSKEEWSAFTAKKRKKVTFSLGDLGGIKIVI